MDAGPFITLPMVFTHDPNTGKRNVGMYRMQVYDRNTTGMHWQMHKVGAAHMADSRKPIEVALAILFHDAIYEPGRPDNEERSADLAIELLRDQAQTIDVPRIAMMIRATKSHDQLAHADDHDLAHFIDADMAIIGTAPHVYDAYAKAVRREFSSIPTAMFEQGRHAFLSKQLARPSLFHTEWFRARYEHAARRNLAHELATLTKRG